MPSAGGPISRTDVELTLLVIGIGKPETVRTYEGGHDLASVAISRHPTKCHPDLPRRIDVGQLWVGLCPTRRILCRRPADFRDSLSARHAFKQFEKLIHGEARGLSTDNRVFIANRVRVKLRTESIEGRMSISPVLPIA